MKNLELKVELKNFDDIIQDIALLKVKEIGILDQTDKYFLIGKKRLKLRDMGNESHLIYYSRPDVQGSRVSKYYVFRFTGQQKTVLEKILKLFFTIKVTVIKKRALYLYKHTRIHLDKVENLGNFLELETIFDKKFPRYDFYHEHDMVTKILGLSRYKKISSSYSDLVYTNK
mgnify:CR=1 FL=1